MVKLVASALIFLIGMLLVYFIVSNEVTEEDPGLHREGAVEETNTSETSIPGGAEHKRDGVDVELTVTLLEHRTYGRVFLEEVSPTSSPKYYLAEPLDVMHDGGSRYSPTTLDLIVGEQYQVSGMVTDPCFDFVEVAGSGPFCIAWLELRLVLE